uniref:Uncharacterized protein n=1 Tax=Tanacetum cinerariifolium TaxID=118510 RepID=A0A699J1I5_TANCI|nr:hypothetical protein [Tanacetum cinerariifolium]
MSISSDLDGPSWGIPLMNAELDEHVPIHVPEPQHPQYHAPSDDDIQVEDDEEDPKEDLNEEHEPEDSNETEPFEEDETAVTLPPPRHRGARYLSDLKYPWPLLPRH